MWAYSAIYIVMKSKQLLIRVSPELFDALVQARAKNNVNVSDLVRDYLTSWVNSNNKKIKSNIEL
jgi:predicted HicB family RNase H-like nuclease